MIWYNMMKRIKNNSNRTRTSIVKVRTFNLTSLPYQQYKKICVSMHDMYNPNSTNFALVLLSWYIVKHTTNVLTINWKLIVNLNFLFSRAANLKLKCMYMDFVMHLFFYYRQKNTFEKFSYRKLERTRSNLYTY